MISETTCDRGFFFTVTTLTTPYFLFRFNFNQFVCTNAKPLKIK